MDFYRSISEKLLVSRGRRKAGVVAGVLAVAVAAGAMGLTSLTGHTKTGAAYCGYDDHEHSEACYAAPLVCDAGASGAIVIHTHDEMCYGPDGNLVCTLPEVRAHEHTDACYQTGGGHYAHDESCYEDVKTLFCDKAEVPQHVHSMDEGCYAEDGTLTCGKIETHSHGDGCYDADGELVCTKPEVMVHVHGPECYHVDYHVLTCTKPLEETAEVVRHQHGPACYETVYGELTCTLEEGEGHVHGIACYGPKAVSGHVHTADCYKPAEKHEHTDACYETIPGKLTCEKAETEGHVHTDACYPVERKLVCGQEESEDKPSDLICTEEVRPATEAALICGQAESDGHVHTDACMDAEGNTVCGQYEGEGAHHHTDDCWVKADPGHVHGDDCYSDPVVGHHHDDSCYEDVRGENPVCGVEEAEPHAHGEGCYAEDEKVLKCKLETGDGHVHTEACHAVVRGNLVCALAGSAGHRHDDDCYEKVDVLLCENEWACGQEAVANDHVHDASCRIDVRGKLTCGIPESRGHKHGEACYDETGKLTCTVEESEGHRHVDACYESVPVMLCENELTCTEGADGGHVHDELCYAQEAKLVCGKEAGEPEAVPTCGKDELVPHEHTAACYMDPKDMHVHGDECYADVEGERVLTCGQLAASDCEVTPDGLVLACGKPAAVVHQHSAACFGTPDLEGEPSCGKHVHTADCYKDPNKKLFGGSDAHITCPTCGEEDIHVHVAGSEICGEQAVEKVLKCEEDHEHTDACWTYYPDCQVGDHACKVESADGTEQPVKSEDPGPAVEYTYVSPDGGFTVTASVPAGTFPVESQPDLRAEALEPGSEGWVEYLTSVGADPETDADSYMVVADVWFVDLNDGEEVLVPAETATGIQVTVTAQEDGYENSSSAAWGATGEGPEATDTSDPDAAASGGTDAGIDADVDAGEPVDDVDADIDDTVLEDMADDAGDGEASPVDGMDEAA